MMDTDGVGRIPLTIMGPSGFRHGVCSFNWKNGHAALFFPIKRNLRMEAQQQCGLCLILTFCCLGSRCILAHVSPVSSSCRFSAFVSCWHQAQIPLSQLPPLPTSHTAKLLPQVQLSRTRICPAQRNYKGHKATKSQGPYNITGKMANYTTQSERALNAVE